MRDLLLVGLGAFFGAIVRYLLSICFIWRYAFVPLGTLAANGIGCFAAGAIFNYLSHKVGTDLIHIRLFLIVGFCGGMTTFSTFSLENLSLLNDGAILQMCIHIILHLIVSLFACWMGMRLGGLMA